MLHWFYTSLEYTNWGMNALTIGAIGTLAFTFIEGWGLHKQNQSIWNNDSGASASVTLFSFLMCFLFAFGIYGFYIKSISMIINGLILGVLHVPIFCGLWKYKTFTTMDKFSVAFSLAMIPAMIVFPWKDGVYLFIASCASLSGIAQAWEIWTEKDSGVVDIRLLITYLGSTLFWIIYATATHETPLMIMAWITLVILIAIIALWWTYRQPFRSNSQIARQENQ